MNKASHLLVGLVLATVSNVSFAATVQVNEIKVMTYNVLWPKFELECGELGNQYKWAETGGPGGADGRRNLIDKILREHKADIIGLQEVRLSDRSSDWGSCISDIYERYIDDTNKNGPFEDIKADLTTKGMNYGWCAPAENSGSEYQAPTPIFYNNESFEAVEDTCHLIEGGDKTATAVILQSKAEKEYLFVVNTHHKCCDKDPQRDEKRQAMTDAINAHIVENNKEDFRIILLGDLNLDLDDHDGSRTLEPIKDLHSKNDLFDVFEKHHPNGENSACGSVLNEKCSSHAGHNNYANNKGDEIKVNYEGARLDHIMASYSLAETVETDESDEPVDIVKDVVLDFPDPSTEAESDIYASDHYPIVATFNIPHYNIPGSIEDGDKFGSTVASGDFNCDGVMDIAIGVPGEDVVGNAITKGGAVNIIYSSGSVETPSQFLSQSDTPSTPDAGDQFGTSLAVGDFDGNGCDDLAVGVPMDSEVSGGGVVNIFYSDGDKEKAIIAGLSISRSETWSQDTAGIAGLAVVGDEFGATLAAGDFNNDGYDDLAIGVPGEYSDAGSVSLIKGSSTGLTDRGDQRWNQDSESASGLKINGVAEAGDRFGDSLAVGDFNGDNFDDLAVGSPGEAIGSLNSANGQYYFRG